MNEPLAKLNREFLQYFVEMPGQKTLKISEIGRGCTPIWGVLNPRCTRNSGCVALTLA